MYVVVVVVGQLHEKFHPIQPMSEKEFVAGDVKLRLTYSPPKGDTDGTLTVLGTLPPTLPLPPFVR